MDLTRLSKEELQDDFCQINAEVTHTPAIVIKNPCKHLQGCNTNPLECQWLSDFCLDVCSEQRLGPLFLHVFTKSVSDKRILLLWKDVSFGINRNN